MDPATHDTTADDTVSALIARSNALGSDPRITNYAGGNTSAKGTDTDPVTGEPVELLWVKGSGGDLGTLTPEGLAVLRVDRVRALRNVYPGVEREDEMVAAFDHTLFGKGGAAPSIDTAMHALVDAAHVDHLHPDAGIAIATAADGPALTERIFGDKVVWVPWRRPGFQLGLDIAAIKDQHPEAVGTILGGHGITAWGSSSEETEANSRWIIDTAEAFIREHGKDHPFGAARAGYEPCRPRNDVPVRPPSRRRSAGSPDTTSPSSVTSRTATSSSTSWRASVPRNSRHSAPAARTTSSAPRSSRSSSTCRRRRASRSRPPACTSCTSSTARTTRRTTTATRRRTPRRSAAPTRSSCSCRVSGCSRTARTRRPPGSRASSTSTPSTSCAARRH